MRDPVAVELHRIDVIRRDAPADPNGNSVSLEDQVLRGVEAMRAHDRAIAVYQASLDLMRMSLGRR